MFRKEGEGRWQDVRVFSKVVVDGGGVCLVSRREVWSRWSSGVLQRGGAFQIAGLAVRLPRLACAALFSTLTALQATQPLMCHSVGAAAALRARLRRPLLCSAHSCYTSVRPSNLATFLLLRRSLVEGKVLSEYEYLRILPRSLLKRKCCGSLSATARSGDTLAPNPDVTPLPYLAYLRAEVAGVL
jgi:hypothetical protein